MSVQDARRRSEVAEAMHFGRWATRYFEFKSDAKSGAERLADSTLSLRRSIYTRILAGPFAKLNLDEIKPVALGELLDRVKSERGPGPAVHARELVLQVYRSYATLVPANATSAATRSRPCSMRWSRPVPRRRCGWLSVACCRRVFAWANSSAPPGRKWTGSGRSD